MSRQPKNGTRPAGRSAQLAMICGLLLAGVSVAPADDHADARFRGTGTADPIRITNVVCKRADTNGATAITFDLAWGHSWRAAWEVGEKEHGGKGPLKLESWDAAWVFAKFRKPGADGWSHATLSTTAADHSVPTGAALDVGPSDDGKRGVGVFVYRNAPGSGANDFKSIKLRWLHEADRTADPKTAELKVFAVQMVYVPQCAFWAGDGSTAHPAGQFSAGDGTEPFRVESEDAVTLGGESKKNLGNRDGFKMHRPDDFTSGGTQTLPARFPKGYAAFYCMRHEITEGQWAECLNAHNFERQAQLTGESKRWNMGKPDDAAGSRIGADGCKISIAVPGVRPSDGQAGKPAVYQSAAPHAACGSLLWSDCTAYAAWAGLRPMTELEYEKACRGPLKPVPDECAWGTAAVAGSVYSMTVGEKGHSGYVLENAGKPGERLVWKGTNGPDASRGNAIWDGAVRRDDKSGKVPDDAVKGAVRGAIFATPDSGRVAAGASYWGIVELSGNLWERVVSVGRPNARHFAGTHGDWPEPAEGSPERWGMGLGLRGGTLNAWPGADDRQRLSTSDRGMSSYQSAISPEATMSRVASKNMGFRCVRTAKFVPLPSGDEKVSGTVAGTAQRVLRTTVPDTFSSPESRQPTPVATKAPRSPTEGSRVLRRAGDWKVGIENVTLSPRDADPAPGNACLGRVPAATVTLDIAWKDSWRDKNNHDAAWVFFKVRADDKSEWQHVRLAADKVHNPGGYGQAQGGTRLDFIVPDGDDGFTGMFVRRAAEGDGPLQANHVTAVCDLAASQGLPKDLKGVSVRAFGILMVYVPEGPFSLGSGDLELGGFYQYTDGSQHTQPYRVIGPGAVPTGRQAGRLWARKRGGPLEDGGEVPASFPNGYAAFYCMKQHITPDQYAAFLNALSAEQADRRYAGPERCVHSVITYSGSNGHVKKSAAGAYAGSGGGPRAGAGCFGLSWLDGASFAAWAGLRPMTELELEKVVRGTRDPVPDEVGPSYWGIGGFNGWDWDALKGDPQCERPVTVSDAAGRRFKGTHGRGTTNLPADWPQADAVGAGLRSTYYSLTGLELVRARAADPAFSTKSYPVSLDGLDLPRSRLSDRFLAALADPERLWSHKWRGVRTAPKGVGL